MPVRSNICAVQIGQAEAVGAWQSLEGDPCKSLQQVCSRTSCVVVLDEILVTSEGHKRILRLQTVL